MTKRAEQKEDVIAEQPMSPQNHFIARTIAKLPTKSQDIIGRLARIKSNYIPCGRDYSLENSLNSMLEQILASNGDRRDDGRILFITGESGAGKSRAVRYMLANNAALQPEQTSYGLIKPVISVSLKGNCTLRVLGQEILKAAGYPIVQKLGPSQIWTSLSSQLAHRSVLIVHIDETQHLLKNTETARDRKDLANALKGVMNDADWPVSFIVSGLPVINSLAREDKQFERRGYFQHLTPIDMDSPEEKQLVITILQEMANAADMQYDAILETDILDRAAHAAGNGYGRITQVVLAALHEAMSAGEDVLTRHHFASAYLLHSNAQGNDEMNPFLCDDWQNLPKGSFIIIDDEDA
ncbi:type II secretory pathway predicted ATPase ExeA [Nitrobacteraceae bacterium AZCC 2161]